MTREYGLVDGGVVHRVVADSHNHGHVLCRSSVVSNHVYRLDVLEPHLESGCFVRCPGCFAITWPELRERLARDD